MKIMKYLILTAIIALINGCAFDSSEKSSNLHKFAAQRGIAVIYGENEHTSTLANPDEMPIDIIGGTDEKSERTADEPDNGNNLGENNNTAKNIGLIVNEDVEWFINYFTEKRRNDFTRWLYESFKYIPEAKRVLRENGIPEELAYLMIIESGGNPKVRSKANAVGLWQFIKSTAERYGLTVNPAIDERKEPALATMAAANYLKDLYKLFGDWELALAGYNCGEECVARVMEAESTDSFWELKTLPRETRRYVPAFYAAVIIASDREKYGFVFEEPQSIAFAGASFMKGKVGAEVRSIGQAMNNDVKEKAAEVSKKLSGRRESSTVAGNPVSISGNAQKETMAVYYPKRGDSLWKISRLYDVQIEQIKKWNKIKNNKIFVEKPLKIYLSSAQAANSESLKGDVYHKVSRGQTLWEISRKYNVKIKTLLALNNLHSDKILAGDTLLIAKD